MVREYKARHLKNIFHFHAYLAKKNQNCHKYSNRIVWIVHSSFYWVYPWTSLYMDGTAVNLF